MKILKETDEKGRTEFEHMGCRYRIWKDGAIERYDGPKLGWNLTHSAMPRSTAHELGLLPEGD